MKNKTLEETYQKKSPLQHILLRPDTYVGSIEMEKAQRWVLLKDQAKFDCKEITYVPALYKIFDEVLVNAADNYQRDRCMNLLKVQINQSQGFISVHNNGKGIPVAIHKDQKIYVPELIFGHLLTGSNYNDDQKKVVGGRNGYGAKLANIFSTKFLLECADGTNKKLFRMQWSRNMTIHSEPNIDGYSGKDYTTVTFFPEFARFGMRCFDDGIVALFNKRVYDMAGLLPNVKVYLNGREITANSFLKYVGMYFPSQSQGESGPARVRDQNVDNERWQVVLSVSDGQFKQVSFVNSICTSKGGTHVNYITDQIVDRIQQKLKKKDKNLAVKPFQIKAHLWIFVNCLIENPSFDSQTKETLTLKQSLFGSECVLSEKLIKQVLKTGIVDDIFNEAKAKQLNKLAKSTAGVKKSKLTGIPKLEDANEAGTRNSEKCTLILTEGDSAKSLAMAGFDVIGRDYFGVFPLKGKLLNVREANSKTLMANEEIQNMIKILGLQINKKYQDVKSLRYGSIMIMADQDTDGSHIKGLVINFIHHFWPSLFQINGFLKQFITPLLKVSKGRQCLSFYTMHDFKQWANEVPNIKTWKVKYYKGLGTSTDKEAKEYFENIDHSRIDFQYMDSQDDDAIDLVFSKKNVEKRKQWLKGYNPSIVMEYRREPVRYKQFVDKQFIHFSNEDNCRSIGSIVDGFKPGQRKIIFACFKRNLKEEIKVAQLAGYVAEHSAYHHGEMSLTMTIVNMAQNYVGSNNINLLMPNGQFGSRNLGGKDHASARYIFTNLNKITRFIYPQADDHTLTYIEDDGQFVQPQFYMPIIPMGLVNGCEGIGSGWSTYIPNYNHREIAQMLLRRLRTGQEFTELHPWYKGYTGDIIRKGDGNYEVKGYYQFDQHDPYVLHVKELPINKWTKNYKIQLDEIMQEGDSKIVGLKEYHTKDRVHFQLQLNQDFADSHKDDKDFWQKFLKLTSNMSLRNMVGFNSEKMLTRYDSCKSIMEQFYNIRIEYYEKRKKYLMSRLQRQLKILTNKQRFILEVVEQVLKIRNVKKIKIVEMLKKAGYTKFSEFPVVLSTKVTGKIGKTEKEEEEEKEQGPQDDGQDESKEYNYLLGLPLWSLSYEKVEQIKRQKTEKNEQLKILSGTMLKDMWINDLTQFLIVADKIEEEEEKERLMEQSKINTDKGKKARKRNDKQKGKQKGNGKQQVKPKEKAVNWDSEDEFVTSSPEDFYPKPKAKPKQGKSKYKITNKVKQIEQPQKQIDQLTKRTDQPSEEDEDLFARVRRKMQLTKANQNNGKGVEMLSGTIMATKPVKTIKTAANIYDNDNDFEVVQVVNPKKSKIQRRMSISSQSDSDESFKESDA